MNDHQESSSDPLRSGRPSTPTTLLNRVNTVAVPHTYAHSCCAYQDDQSLAGPIARSIAGWHRTPTPIGQTNLAAYLRLVEPLGLVPRCIVILRSFLCNTSSGTLSQIVASKRHYWKHDHIKCLLLQLLLNCSFTAVALCRARHCRCCCFVDDREACSNIVRADNPIVVKVEQMERKIVPELFLDQYWSMRRRECPHKTWYVAVCDYDTLVGGDMGIP